MFTQFWKDIDELHRLVEALPKPKVSYSFSVTPFYDFLMWFRGTTGVIFTGGAGTSLSNSFTSGYWEVIE
jgi:hypothetical protein